MHIPVIQTCIYLQINIEDGNTIHILYSLYENDTNETTRHHVDSRNIILFTHCDNGRIMHTKLVYLWAIFTHICIFEDVHNTNS